MLGRTTPFFARLPRVRRPTRSGTLAAACGAALALVSIAAFPPVATAKDTPPSFLLFVMDTTRADGVERDGVYLLPTGLVVRTHERYRYFPRTVDSDRQSLRVFS